MPSYTVYFQFPKSDAVAGRHTVDGTEQQPDISRHDRNFKFLFHRIYRICRTVIFVLDRLYCDPALFIIDLAD